MALCPLVKIPAYDRKVAMLRRFRQNNWYLNDATANRLILILCPPSKWKH